MEGRPDDEAGSGEGRERRQGARSRCQIARGGREGLVAHALRFAFAIVHVGERRVVHHVDHRAGEGGANDRRPEPLGRHEHVVGGPPDDRPHEQAVERAGRREELLL